MTPRTFWRTVFLIVSLTLALALFLLAGCRMICYTSIGTEQDFDELTVRLVKYHAEPQMDSLVNLIELWMKGN